MDPRTDEAGGSVRLHFDDERTGSTGVAQTDQCVDTVVGAGLSLALDRLDLNARHVVEQVANCIHGADLWCFHRSSRFQHVMNMGKTVKSARIFIFLERPDMTRDSEVTRSPKRTVGSELRGRSHRALGGRCPSAAPRPGGVSATPRSSPTDR